MPRILDPGQIETFAQRDIPRLRLPDRAQVFATRAARLRQQSQPGAVGHAIGDYLRLMAHLVDAQQFAVTVIEPAAPTAEQIAQSQSFCMPLISANGWRRDEQWRHALRSICDSVASVSELSRPARAVCDRVQALNPEELETQADTLLAAKNSTVDAATAPFLMAALQVYWVALASQLRTNDIHDLDVPGLCPICGTLPVASVVRADSAAQGFRFLHCTLCAAEWHMVRVKCSHCQTTKDITYQSIENGPTYIRAECCDTCRTYRKILYQEADTQVEPVADDLASVALDLMLGQAGYHRTGCNPFLWT